jgi:predicted AAA+ superfamily ATPase
MIERIAQSKLLDIATRYPVVTVLGPRQSGKTTLCRSAFAHKPYATLENPVTRAQAIEDPVSFLGQFPEGAVLDEVQRAPELLSFIQAIVDAKPTPGQFVLTGSEHLGLAAAVSQSLAGRTALLYLMPLSLAEIRRFADPPRDLYTVLFTGGYPRIYDQHLPASEWLANYVATYLERDVRQVINVSNMMTFQRFVGLCAGRSAQLLNISGLASDAGIAENTAKAWLSVLEATFVAYRLAPVHRNFNKRLVKTGKLVFCDTGLLCFLLGIREPAQIAQHPLRGAIFETWCINEIRKQRLNRGMVADMFFYRDRQGQELDLVIDNGASVELVEIKAGQTLASDYFATLDKLAPLFASQPGMAEVRQTLIYAGDTAPDRRGIKIVGWSDLDRLDKHGSLHDLEPESYAVGTEDLDENIDAIVHGSDR